jgi:tetratricopeptide (TPR) repeat protein
MNPLDDVPERHLTHDIGRAALTAFDAAISAYDYFVIQQRGDETDYGTDMQIEARHGPGMTNLRVDVQLKGTTTDANTDGSVSIPVERRNLNYLLAQPDAIYVCYHLPTQRLLARYATDVWTEYERRGGDWARHQSITVRCLEAFDEPFQKVLNKRVVAAGRTDRDRRLEWSATPPTQIPALVERSLPTLELPTDPERARAIIQQLYDAGKDAVISASFSRIEAVLGDSPPSMTIAYMAEINLGINGSAIEESRIHRGIEEFRRSLERSEMHPASALYCIGNALLALRRYEDAKQCYLQALTHLSEQKLPELAAQIHKNLGSALEDLKDLSGALQHYRKSLEPDPDLPEAHFAIAQLLIRTSSNFDEALSHLDSVSGRRGSPVAASTVHGWRIRPLFETGDISGAFREMSSLLAASPLPAWAWPWCARLVAQFAAVSLDATRHAASLWRKFLAGHPGHIVAERNLCICLATLRMHDQPTGTTFEQFLAKVAILIEKGVHDPAHLWDRVGHWAQCDGDWQCAEDLYRKAYDLEPERYGYCYGAALNFQKKYGESLPILLAQAEKHLPDELSWFQVGVARAGLKDPRGAIAAYQRAVELDPSYEVAWFNLGGEFWNAGDHDRARSTWREAADRFPDDPAVDTIRTEFPAVLDDNEEDQKI